MPGMCSLPELTQHHWIQKNQVLLCPPTIIQHVIHLPTDANRGRAYGFFFALRQKRQLIPILTPRCRQHRAFQGEKVTVGNNHSELPPSERLTDLFRGKFSPPFWFPEYWIRDAELGGKHNARLFDGCVTPGLRPCLSTKFNGIKK